MPTTITVPAAPVVGGHHGWRIVAALAVTSTIGYGTLYYAYAVLLTPMAATLGTSTTAVTGALTASVLAGALAAIPVGRWLDHHGGRALMTTGSITATALLIAWSWCSTLFASPDVTDEAAGWPTATDERSQAGPRMMRTIFVRTRHG
ncbi:hypothetical protein PSN13_01434 [Micromonospora saelicesensis]|uniref:Major facilitator superfamily (MFS) profile domain-containing protein n=1 Tax=Micromonospora saelicesensis TaxID=285676 RepID=A0A328NWN6_9ACTN|nr:hypothetical protein [Micromonospora saelicesensis]RAO37452.1 hypothetical protein PSN13_01434 [Micromonospora saelicesensis]